MKIVVIGQDPHLFDSDSDVRRRVASYARHFDGYHVVVFSEFGHPAEIKGEGFRIYPTNSRLFLFRVFDAARIARAATLREGADLIDAQDAGESGIAAWLASRRTGVPFRLQIHTDVFSPQYRRAGWKEYVRYILARFLIPRAACVRVVSERIKDSLYRSKIGTNLCTDLRSVQAITVLPIYTDISLFLKGQRDPLTEERFRDYNFKMVAVGRFVDKEKNFSMLIDMMRELVRTHPRALLVLVGDGPDKKKYELRIKNYGLKNSVILEHWREDLPSFLKSFDTLLLTSNYEGWGRVVIEAMAAGLPVVMTDVGLAGEVVKNGENGMVVPVGDRETLLRACRTLADDLAFRKRLAEAGQRIVLERFGALNQESYARIYADVFRSCV